MRNQLSIFKLSSLLHPFFMFVATSKSLNVMFRDIIYFSIGCYFG